MLDDTLVIFGGEFGRTPTSQTGDGRDHHIKFRATMLHLVGIDHKRLAVQFQGLDVRLTGVTGDVVTSVLA
jgi:hypothetical protein